MNENVIKQCKGEGLGSCTLCEKRHGFHRTWMNMLYKIEGIDGIYHYECAKQMLAEKYGTENKPII